ncbi:2-succinyl-5-enolpyruvyl-6-hydroxy-3-cyclohexene-1-carboxylic-acid synthase [uncultured Algibacter sp.]|uniref:2-succinyl-5-enolpyruvyl-6-hydroxy-3- cyclohexene-1-carboxylic-acid synthase n=1 Tax=uncultured Algibacter sp. TaxID=298659 RepID=UPI00262B14E7|nr:2-succinyl-5-enolpyruvyl-6-hydroxy-3-cyclohexene-1-carboxylic-acid synthase [uncultured Algibacter sp.]
MTYPKIPLAQTVVQLCKAKEVKHIIISPGSRNAPLTIGFTNDNYFKCYSIVDERCAAFFALGIAQQLNKPTALVCTSGSALLNYYPAVAEAYYSNIPLIVLSADRPEKLIGIGDGQTINQKNVFDNHILLSRNLKLDLKDEFEYSDSRQEDIQIYNEKDINEAINMSVLKKGPVHINIPFDEPLYEMISALSVNPSKTEVSVKPKHIEGNMIQSCAQVWNAATKKMILVGTNPPNELEQKWLDILANDDSVIVLTETTSNLHHSSFFPSIDKLIAPLTEEEQKALQPDILLTFGGLIISKKIKQLLRKFKPKHHWHIDSKQANDTFFSLNNHIEATPNQFFEVFLPKVTHSIKSDYKINWSLVKQNREEKHEEYLKEIPFSDFKVFNKVLKSIPDNYILQSGNSSAIRYTQLFNLNNTVEVYCNRGTSGIDGSTATAIGCAVSRNKPTIFISGDLSFLYDSNGLWNNYIPKSFRIIVINNQGGGIFRILPGHKNTENFDTYFETTHNLTAEYLCRMHAIQYTTSSSEETLEVALKSFYTENEQPKLLEIFTPKAINDDVLLKYFEFIK